MNCRKAEWLMQNSLDDALSPAERRALAAHISDCVVCYEASAQYQQLRRTASNWLRTDDPGDAFTDAVMAQIAAQSTPASFPAMWPRLAYAGCLFAALVLLSYCVAPFVPDVRLSMNSWLPSLTAAARLPLSLLENMPTGLITPQWLYAALIAACALNVALLRAARRGRRFTT